MLTLLILYTVCAIFMFLFLRSIYKLLVLLPGRRHKRKIKSITNIGKKKKDLIDYFYEYLMIAWGFVSKQMERFNIAFSKYDQDKLIEDLNKVSPDETPERFRAKQILYPIIYFSGTLILSTIFRPVPMLSYIVLGTGVILSLLMSFVPQSELNKKVEQHNEQIIREMPRFLITYKYSPENMDVLKVIDDYLSSGESYLDYDFKQIIAQVQSGISIDNAFDNFAKKIGIPVITELTIVLKSSLKNKEKNMTNLELIENKIVEINEENIEKEYEKRLPILNTINEVMIYALLLIIVVPMVLKSYQGIAEMFNG